MHVEVIVDRARLVDGMHRFELFITATTRKVWPYLPALQLESQEGHTT